MKNTLKVSICILLTLIFCVCGLCACNDDKDEIYENPQKLGDFYTLEEAYEQGFLSHDDLVNIAYYNHGADDSFDFPGGNPDFVVTPKNPEVLSEETKSAICETFAYYWERGVYAPQRTNIYKDEIKVGLYYGTYNGCAVVAISRTGVFTTSIQEYMVGGIGFRITDELYPILVWKAI